MKKNLMYVLLVALFTCCSALFMFKTEYNDGIVLLLLGAYLLLVMLILYEHRKTQDMMGRLLNKVGKSREEIVNYLDKA